MLKVINHSKNKELEIIPHNNCYTVFELGNYEILYENENVDVESLEIILGEGKVEDELVSVEEGKIKLENYRYFEDYFGYIFLYINGEKFIFNVNIDKLKLSEIEDIFVYLWKKENKLLDIFLLNDNNGGNFYTRKVKNETESDGNTVRLMEYIEKYVFIFDKMYALFSKSPHTVMRNVQKEVQYSPEKITPDTLSWIATSLDEIHFDNSFRGHVNSININKEYGFVDTINTNVNINSLNNYENEVILGSFKIVLKKLKELKFEINKSIEEDSDKGNDNYRANFKDLKKIPLLKLLNDTEILEIRVKKVFERYKSLFKGVKPRIEKPILTSVFLQKLHYKKAFWIIKKVIEYKFDIIGSLKLLSINKLSRLYEVYNLYTIIDVVKKKLNLDVFSFNVRYNVKNKIVDKISFEERNTYYTVNIYYELKYWGREKSDQETLLRRIDSDMGQFYNPDFIIEIVNPVENLNKYYIFDAKYSKMQTVKDIYLPELIDKYILKTGIENNPNGKVSSLCLIFPGDIGKKVIDNYYFEPNIRIICSKPNNTADIKYNIEMILENNLPPNLLYS